MTFRRVFTGAWKGYRGSINVLFSPKYLFFTNVVLSMSISTTGDVLEQSYEIHAKELLGYDLHRTGHMAFSGTVAGVICHHWYKVLDKVIIGRTLRMAIKKLLLDQFVCSPLVIMSFFATVAIFEDNPIENFSEEVQDKFWILYKAEWVVWPPAQMINFCFLPLRFRVLYDNTISLGYDVFTSHVKHDKSAKEKRKQKSNVDDDNDNNM